MKDSRLDIYIKQMDGERQTLRGGEGKLYNCWAATRLVRLQWLPNSKTAG